MANASARQCWNMVEWGHPSKDNPDFWSGTPLVSPKDMKAARLGDAIDHVSNAAVGNGTRLVPSDTLLMVVRGMILAHTFPVALTTSEVTFNQDIRRCRLRASSCRIFFCTGFRAVLRKFSN